MARWTGTWLQGPGVTLRELRDPTGWPGQRLGLPRDGSGSMATFSVRAFGFVLDIVACSLIGGLISSGLDDPSPETRQLVSLAVLLAEQVLFVAAFGQTLGMRLMGVKVLRLKDITRPPGFLVALGRALPLVLSLGLAGLFSRDGRGLHDVLAGSAVVRD